MILNHINTAGIIDAIGDLVTVQDTDYRVIYQNSAHRDLAGDHIGEYCYKAYQDRDRICEGCHLSISFRDGKTRTVERISNTNEGIRYYEHTASVLKGLNGEIIAGIELVRDISKRKQAEEALIRSREEIENLVQERTSELTSAVERLHKEIDHCARVEKEIHGSKDFFNSILNGINNGVWVTNKDDVVFYTNRAMTDIAGIPGEQIKNMHVLTGFPENTLKYFRPYYLKAKKDLKPVKYDALPVVIPSGRESYQAGWLIPRLEDGKFNGMICTVEDITDRKKAEEGLSKSEERFRLLFESSNDLITLADASARPLWSNKAWRKRFGSESKYSEDSLNMVYPDDREKVITAWNGLVSGKGSLRNLEYRYKINNGDYLTFESSAYPVDMDDEIFYFVIARDITERKKAEEEIESLAKFPSENPNPVLRVSRDKTVLYKNEAFDCLMQESGLKDEDIFQLLPENLDNLIGESFKEKKSYFMLEVIVDSKVFSYNLVPIPEHGYVNLYGRDITERKNAEKLLKESEEKFRLMVENLPRGAIYLEKDRIYLNRAVEQMIGYTRAEITTLDAWFTKLYGREADTIRGYYDQDRIAGFPFARVLPVTKKCGSYCYIEFIGYSYGKGEIWLLTDITERKQAEDKLKRSEEKYQDLYDNAPDMYHSLDKKGIITECNRTWLNMLGYEKDEVVGRPLTDFFTDESKSFFEKLFPSVSKKRNLLNIERNIVRKDGTVFPVILNVFVEMDENNKFIGTRAISRDITERKRAEEAIQNSELRFKELFNNMSSGVAVYKAEEDGEDFLFLDINKSGEAISDIKRESIIGRRVTDMFPGVKELGLFDVFQRVWRTGKPEHLPLTLYKDSRISHWVENYVYKLPSGEVVAVYDDITKRKRAESELEGAFRELKETQEQLLQSSKMAAIGQLAAGISHELNQPLTGIKGFAQAVLMDLDKDSPLTSDLNKIVEQSNRMDKIIRHMRMFAKKSEFEFKETDVNRPVEDSLMLLNEQFRIRNIRLITVLAKDLPNIMADANQMEQAFINILTNARDAIEICNRLEGGEITIKTALSRNKKHIKISFEDTGCGISEDDIKNILNPFYTTKSPDRGMGLGLSIMYRIVEDHRGKIDIKSKKDKGSTFTISLPTI